MSYQFVTRKDDRRACQCCVWHIAQGQTSNDIGNPATVGRHHFTSNRSEHESAKSDPGKSSFIRDCQLHAARGIVFLFFNLPLLSFD